MPISEGGSPIAVASWTDILHKLALKYERVSHKRNELHGALLVKYD